MSRSSASGTLRGPLLVALVVIVLDQLTKAAVVTWMPRYHPLSIVDGFLNLVHVRNPGAAFSLFADAPEWFRRPFFIGVTIISMIFLVALSRRLGPEERAMRIALGAVLGGALGNLIDRFVHGEVIDFVDVYWGACHWPAFNVADFSISLAVIVILVQSFGNRGGPKKGADT